MDSGKRLLYGAEAADAAVAIRPINKRPEALADFRLILDYADLERGGSCHEGCTVSLADSRFQSPAHLCGAQKLRGAFRPTGIRSISTVPSAPD
jgi:hypothetical protein